jgi:membrane-associated phospholipid phosphatase
MKTHAALFYIAGILSLIHSKYPVYSFESEKVDSIFISDIQKSVYDLKYVGNEFVEASQSSILTAGIMLGTSISLMPYDEDMRKTALRNRETIDGFAITIANEYGNLVYPALGMLTTYGLGLATSDESIRTFARKTSTSLLVAGGITTVLKSMIGRSRPFTNEGSSQFYPFSIDDSKSSFPSGHTTIAFVMSASLSKVIDTWWADVLLYCLATGTAYGRIHNDRHWLSDTVLGGIIGYYAVQWVYDSEKEKDFNEKKNMTIIPLIQPQSIGMIIQF